MDEVNEARALILAMADQAFTEWADGTEERMFPATEETWKNPADMLWNATINAMAYGFAKGLAAGERRKGEKKNAAG